VVSLAASGRVSVAGCPTAKAGIGLGDVGVVGADEVGDGVHADVDALGLGPRHELRRAASLPPMLLSNW